MMALRGGADLVIATPGRLLDLVERNALHLGRLEALVLDEADRLFSLGFADELARVLALLPARRQNLLFSATLPAPVLELAERLLHEPTRIDIDGGQTATHPASNSAPSSSMPASARRCCGTCSRRTPGRRARLRRQPVPRRARGHEARALEHPGGVAARRAQLRGPRSKRSPTSRPRRLTVLVATDLAARGLDIEQLPAVINYDLPRSPVDYLHRIGRTGRASETGTAISFVSVASVAHFRLIEKRHHLDLALEELARLRAGRARRAAHRSAGRREGPAQEQEGQAARGSGAGRGQLGQAIEGAIGAEALAPLRQSYLSSSRSLPEVNQL